MLGKREKRRLNLERRNLISSLHMDRRLITLGKNIKIVLKIHLIKLVMN